MLKTSRLRFWLANRSYHQSRIGRTISHSWLYHQSWTIDCQISWFWSYNWSYPLTIGRATSRRTPLWLNMHLRTTCADWLLDLRRLMDDPTRSSVIVRSFARPVVRFAATGRQTNRCMRSNFCRPISPNIHDRLYILQIDRNRTTKNRTIQCDYCFTVLIQSPISLTLVWSAKFERFYGTLILLLTQDHMGLEIQNASSPTVFI